MESTLLKLFGGGSTGLFFVILFTIVLWITKEYVKALNENYTLWRDRYLKQIEALGSLKAHFILFQQKEEQRNMLIEQIGKSYNIIEAPLLNKALDAVESKDATQINSCIEKFTTEIENIRAQYENIVPNAATSPYSLKIIRMYILPAILVFIISLFTILMITGGIALIAQGEFKILLKVIGMTILISIVITFIALLLGLLLGWIYSKLLRFINEKKQNTEDTAG